MVGVWWYISFYSFLWCNHNLLKRTKSEPATISASAVENGLVDASARCIVDRFDYCSERGALLVKRAPEWTAIHAPISITTQHLMKPVPDYWLHPLPEFWFSNICVCMCLCARVCASFSFNMPYTCPYLATPSTCKRFVLRNSDTRGNSLLKHFPDIFTNEWFHLVLVRHTHEFMLSSCARQVKCWSERSFLWQKQIVGVFVDAVIRLY